MDSNPDSVQEMIRQLMEALRNSQETTQIIRETFMQALSEQKTRHQEELDSLREELQAIKSSLLQGISQDPPKDTPSTDTASKRTSYPPVVAYVRQSPSEDATSSPAVIYTRQQLSDKLPDPPMFGGKRRDLALFVQKLRYKLEGNADRYPDDRAKLIYAHSRIEKDAAVLVMPLMGTDIQTADQLISFLESTYGDRHKEQTAWRRLETMKQGNKGFLPHFAEFRRLIADTNLNEHAQIPYLQRTLSDELRRAMVGVTIPATLNEYANLISAYDNDLRYLPRSQPVRSSRRDPDAMEIDTATYAPAGSSERQQRIQDGRCFKCNKKGHISRDCSVPLPRIRTNSASLSKSSSPRPTTRRRESYASVASSTTRRPNSSQDSRGRSRTGRRSTKNSPSRR